MSTERHGRVRNLSTLALVGGLAGVIVAAAVFPLVAASGLAAKAGAQSFEELPTDFTLAKAPQATRVFAADGKTLIATFFDENRRDVPMGQVADTMPKALIAAEDQSFYEHNGVDIGGLFRAAVVNQVTDSQQGGSTLSMQLVRMLATYGATDPQQVIDATEKSNARKLRETKLAVSLDHELGKEKILERYLNMAPLGHATYGVYAAANYYFGKPPAKLDLAESALLAGMIRSPSDYDPLDPDGLKAALERRDWVLDQMQATGSASAAEVAAAKKVKHTFVGKAPVNGCSATKPNDWGFFCDYFRRWWLGQEAFGSSGYDRERRLMGGGYEVVTTLDPKVQKAAKRNVEENLRTGRKEALMVSAVEPGTGRVRALATNRTYGIDDPAKPKNKKHSDPRAAAGGAKGTYPVTSNPLLTGGGGVNGYQAGSTFKIFSVVAALKEGYPLALTIDAKQQYRSGYPAPAGAPGSCRDIPRYCPTNDNDGMVGVHDMWSAFGRSVNTYFVPLQEQVGTDKVVQAAEDLGIRFMAPSDAELAADPDTWGAFTLGVSAVTPLDLANAYATLAADGMHCEPTPVQKIVDGGGATLDVANPRCNRAVSTEVARAAVDAARCPVGDQSAFGRCRGATAPGAHAAVDQPVAGKTGTTDSNRTASLVVMTRSLAVAGILADPDYPQTPEQMDHGIVNPAVWNTLAAAVKGKKAQDFPKPKETTVFGKQRSIPDVMCSSVAEATAELTGAGFTVRVDDVKVPSRCAAGTVGEVDPSRQTVVGGVVRLRVSSGVQAPPSPSGPAVPPPPR